MKFIKLLSLLFLGIALMVSSCSEEELDGDALTDLPPGVLSISPADNAKVVIGYFDVKAILADGLNSPLASATLTLANQDGTILGTKSQDLTGTRDSIILEGSEFDAEQLGAGIYQIDLLATDASGNELTRTTTFEISLLPFAANHEEMFLAGAFNGWGADVMTLVADHTWEITEVDLMGQAWKIKNCIDWCDEDWGDTNCDNIMESNKTGNGDTDCGYSGMVNIRFNDQTLTYSVRPSVEFATNLSGLYLLGTFNNFAGSDYSFSLVADNTWELEEVLLSPGDEFKFAEMPNFMGKNYGDIEGDGVADEFSDNNIVFPADSAEAFYKITFNDKSLEYNYEFVRGLFPSELYLVGAFNGWDAASAIPFMEVDDGVFEIYAPLEAGNGFKFLQELSFNNDWGPSSDDPNMIVQEGEVDATVDESGFYRITVDFNDMSIAYLRTEWGIIGDATGSWDVDIDMTLQNDFEWVVTLDLTANFIKFRANDLWELDFGDDGGDGTLDFKGADIPVPEAGNYTVYMRLNPEAYTYELVKN